MTEPTKASFSVRRRNLILSSFVLTFVGLRLYLHMSPSSNFDVAGYNIHHLFTGLLLITFSAIPLILLNGRNRWIDIGCIVFGAGLSMALDEWVYLIVTDGSDASYLLPVSFWGGAIMILLVVALTLVLSIGKRPHNRP